MAMDLIGKGRGGKAKGGGSLSGGKISTPVVGGGRTTPQSRIALPKRKMKGKR